MAQNRSSAVMAQRSEPHDSLDFFPTPAFATRALCEHVVDLRDLIVYDPCCGEGHMVRPLHEYAAAVGASDIHDYGCGFAQHDFLMPYLPDGVPIPDWCVFNPPYRLAEQFIQRALAIASIGIAVLVRTQFVEGEKRHASLFSIRPPTVIAQFSERVPMFKGRIDEDGSSATAYCWMIWLQDRNTPTQFAWIPPCRTELERPSDYPNEQEVTEDHAQGADLPMFNAQDAQI